MHRRKIILVGLALFISGPAHAGDLGWAGALSGAGNAMGQSMQQMQNAIIQKELMRRQAEAQQQRDEQQARWERERQEQAFQHQMKMQRDEQQFIEEQRARRAHQDQVQVPAAIQPRTTPQTDGDERLRKWRENDPSTHDVVHSQSPVASPPRTAQQIIEDERIRQWREK